MSFVVQNWYLFATALVSGGLLLWPLLVQGGTGGHRISAAEAVTLINREKAVLIDIRDAKEYAAAHALGARSVPLESIGGSRELPKNKSLPIVVVCGNGTRSARAIPALKKAGYENVRPLTGGLAGWRAASLPIERAEAAA